MLSAWLIGCALLMKILIPAGFMPVVSNGVVGIAICSGSMPVEPTMSMPMSAAMPGMAHHPDKPDHQGRELPCAFAGLSAQSLAAVDPLVLAAVIAFVVALGVRATTARRLVAASHLRPPLRGPPALI